MVEQNKTTNKIVQNQEVPHKKQKQKQKKHCTDHALAWKELEIIYINSLFSRWNCSWSQRGGWACPCSQLWPVAKDWPWFGTSEWICHASFSLGIMAVTRPMNIMRYLKCTITLLWMSETCLCFLIYLLLSFSWLHAPSVQAEKKTKL